MWRVSRQPQEKNVLSSKRSIFSRMVKDITGHSITLSLGGLFASTLLVCNHSADKQKIVISPSCNICKRFSSKEKYSTDWSVVLHVLITHTCHIKASEQNSCPLSRFVPAVYNHCSWTSGPIVPELKFRDYWNLSFYGRLGCPQKPCVYSPHPSLNFSRLTCSLNLI